MCFFKIFFLFISSSLLLSFLRFSLLFSCLVSPLTCLFILFFLYSFLFSHFSFLLSSSFSISFTVHTETRSTRQVTPPTKNGHAPRDPLNQERAINLTILAMSHPEVFPVLSQIRPQAPLLVVPIRPCLISMINVLYALPGFRPRLSQEILCIAKLLAANHSPKVMLKMSSRHGLWLRRRRLMSSAPYPSFVINDNIFGKCFRGNSASNISKNFTSENKKQYTTTTTSHHHHHHTHTKTYTCPQQQLHQNPQTHGHGHTHSHTHMHMPTPTATCPQQQPQPQQQPFQWCFGSMFWHQRKRDEPRW